jgi:hypothetical protein
MIEITITLNDVTKRRELLDLVANLPYVEAVQVREEDPAAYNTTMLPFPANGKRTLSEQRPAEKTPQADPLDREVAFFEEQHEQLVAHFLGQYIAMYQGQVIGHHPDLAVLIADTQQTHPDTPVLFRQVQATLPPTLFFRSPRLLRY